MARRKRVVSHCSGRADLQRQTERRHRLRKRKLPACSLATQQPQRLPLGIISGAPTDSTHEQRRHVQRQSEILRLAEFGSQLRPAGLKYACGVLTAGNEHCGNDVGRVHVTAKLPIADAAFL